MGVQEHNTTAVLVFANSSEEELTHKPLLNGEVLFDQLTRRTIKVVQESKLPYFHFCEKEQSGISFSERFTNALKAVFEKGYVNVIAVGNDTPHLKTSHILEAFGKLKSGQMALGPSADGGFYLLGIRKNQFFEEKFKALPWQTNELAQAMMEISLEQGVEVFNLPTLFDIDSARDLKKFIHRFQNIGKRLVSLMSSLFSSNEVFLERGHISSYHCSLQIHGTRGSPF